MDIHRNYSIADVNEAVELLNELQECLSDDKPREADSMKHTRPYMIPPRKPHNAKDSAAVLGECGLIGTPTK